MWERRGVIIKNALHQTFGPEVSWALQSRDGEGEKIWEGETTSYLQLGTAKTEKTVVMNNNLSAVGKERLWWRKVPSGNKGVNKRAMDERSGFRVYGGQIWPQIFNQWPQLPTYPCAYCLYCPFWWLWGHYSLQTASEVKSDLRFEISDRN